MNIFLYILSISFLLKVVVPLIAVAAIAYFIASFSGIDLSFLSGYVKEIVDTIKNFF